MANPVFNIITHTVPCQHIREYAFAIDDEQETELSLAVKQYIPRSNPNPKKGDITIIGAHATGFGKECYEPLWEDLLIALEARGVSIRAIWFADTANHGASYVLNEDKLGNEPGWQDHARDLLAMVNHFRRDIKRPIIGIGHSMGASNLVDLSLMHPRLFTTLVLVEAALGYPNPVLNWYPSIASVARRDHWASRAEAGDSLHKNVFYRKWDPRVIDRYLESGLRRLPTRLYHAKAEGEAVTLTTPREQEVFMFLRPNFPSATHPDPAEFPDRTVNADVDPSAKELVPFYCPGPVRTLHNLPHVRPSVLYILGTESPFSTMADIEYRMKHTGVGVDGSGGVAAGRVQHVLLPGNHFLPFEGVRHTADALCEWIFRDLEHWSRVEREQSTKWNAVPVQERQKMSKEAVEILLNGPPRATETGNSKL